MSIAKTLPPFLPGLFKRTRLFNLLDQYRSYPALWVQGQAGAGKTSLVASYINQCELEPLWYRVDACDDDPATFFHYIGRAAKKMIPDRYLTLPEVTMESLGNLNPFAGQFFRELFERAAKPMILVFDNIHTLGPDSLMNDIFSVILDEIPQGVHLIMISRNPPPVALSRMQVNRRMAMIGPDLLRLTDEEVYSLSKLWSQHKAGPETIRHMNELTDGWIAGLVLLFERGKLDDSVIEIDNDYFFRYFASEIFDNLDEKKQNFLLHTACLNNITPPVASELTGIPQAIDILDDLCARNYFTSKSDQPEPVYRYHPLFKDFLLVRGAREFGSAKSKKIAARAAGILASLNQTEDAIELAKYSEDFFLMRDLVKRQAPEMLAQQRLQQLEKWLKSLPVEIHDSSPWFHYWSGCCRLPFNQKESRIHYELAYDRFKKQDDPEGVLLSASGVIIAIMTQWDDFRSLAPWILALDNMAGEDTGFSSNRTEAMVVLAMLSALLFHMPQHPKMEYWATRADKIIRDNNLDISIRMDTGNALAHCQFWKGDLACATHTIDILSLLVDEKKSATLPRLQSAMNQAILDWHRADFDQCLKRIDKGMALAGEMDFHILDDRLIAQSIFACLSTDNLPDASQLLDRMKRALKNQNRLSLSFYYYLSSLRHVLAGDLEMARQEARTAVDINKEVGAPYPEALTTITLACIHFQMGEVALAEKMLTKAWRAGMDMNSRTLELICELTRAWFHLNQDRNEKALVHLEKALSLQKKMGFINFPGWQTSMMKPLLLKALKNDIETDFVRDLIRKRNLHADSTVQISEKWPWPVRIYTFGGFSLYIDDGLLEFKGKAQQKPLELLKTLIALGGADVSKDRLMDFLWPDAEGDKGAKALDTTLHRFRKLIKSKQIIQVQGGKLSLNPRLCWLDTWAMENMFTQIETLMSLTSPDPEKASQLGQQLINRHKGCFLKDDHQPDCIISYRGYMYDRYLNRLGRIGSFWETLKDWDQAIAFYRRLVELDPRQEYFHQRLILSYRNQGLASEALAAFERCREALLFHYGIAPSARTEALLKSLQ